MVSALSSLGLFPAPDPSPQSRSRASFGVLACSPALPRPGYKSKAPYISQIVMSPSSFCYTTTKIGISVATARTAASAGRALEPPCRILVVVLVGPAKLPCLCHRLAVDRSTPAGVGLSFCPAAIPRPRKPLASMIQQELLIYCADGLILLLDWSPHCRNCLAALCCCCLLEACF